MPKLRVQLLLELFTRTTSQHVLILCVENVLAVAGGKIEGRLGGHSVNEGIHTFLKTLCSSGKLFATQETVCMPLGQLG